MSHSFLIRGILNNKNGLRQIRSLILKRNFINSMVTSKILPYPPIQLQQPRNVDKCFLPVGLNLRKSYATDADFPKHLKVALPALSPTMERGTLVKWAKNEGDKLNEGDLLAEIETDKATMGFETPEEGYLAKIFVPANTKDIPLGKLLCIIVSEESDVSSFKTYTLEISDATATIEFGVQNTIPSPPAKIPSSEHPPVTPKAQNALNYPKHILVNLPSLSPTMEKGNIQSWMVKEGDQLREGDVLAQIETDKATMDFETPEEGYIAKILQPAGTKGLSVGQLLCIIVENKEDIPAFSNYKAENSAQSILEIPLEIVPSYQITDPQPPLQAQQSSGGPVSISIASKSVGGMVEEQGKLPASPLAKRLAKEKGVDLNLIQGTGAGGSVTAKDIETYVPKAVASPTIVQSTTPPPIASSPRSPIIMTRPESAGVYVDIPLSNMRQIIAKRLLLSKQTIPHYYLSIDVQMDNIIRLRKELNELLMKDKVKLSVNDFIIKASALACNKVPEANSSWQETYIRQNNNVDINVAVATEAGLITPIVFNADKKGLASISIDVMSLADKAKAGKLQPHEFQGGTFTISNLGMFGIKSFSAIINPPQACILAVGGSDKKLIPDENSNLGYKTVNVMNVTLSCDHRVVDGAVGAKWLSHFKKFLEKPDTMLL